MSGENARSHEVGQGSRAGGPTRHDPSRTTILVVDDEPDVLASVTDALQLFGYGVIGSTDPREALRITQTHPSPIRLLLTDVVMPYLSGPELAEHVRRRFPDIKILFMSAFTTEAVADSGVRLPPGIPLLVKPFSMNKLAEKVRATLEYRSPFSRP
jgi:two-component system, cell cycle sensor histidine kinase and response regulator CckA